jgi:hypothetical protein
MVRFLQESCESVTACHFAADRRVVNVKAKKSAAQMLGNLIFQDEPARKML